MSRSRSESDSSSDIDIRRCRLLEALFSEMPSSRVIGRPAFLRRPPVGVGKGVRGFGVLLADLRTRTSLVDDGSGVPRVRGVDVALGVDRKRVIGPCVPGVMDTLARVWAGVLMLM